MRNKLDIIGIKALSGEGITRDEALSILRLEDNYLLHLLSWTDRMRQTFTGNTIDLWSVINARSGGCTEDCSFCSQSVHFSTGIGTYPLLPLDTIVENARAAKSCGATKFCLATSGTGIRNDKELDKLCMAVERIKKEVDIGVCATLGALTEKEMIALKTAGLTRFHHNLETAEAYFPNVCTTHTYQDRVEEV
ncbi:MAG: radical SAM protein, partial [Nitrospirae bacterium]|nr:radical SAM protein [Nitrospirota bacterium]